MTKSGKTRAERAATPASPQHRASIASPSAHIADLQRRADASTKTAELAALQRAADRGVAQRKVMIDGKEAYVANPTTKKVAHGSSDFIPTATELDWVEDKSKRNYKTEAEFHTHTKGDTPVPFGLAGQKTKKWFRLEKLPGGASPEFFILGENHNDVNYRELLGAANQTGKVLGEGGMTADAPMSPDSDLEEDAASLKNTPVPLPRGLQEFTMENLIAKVYFPGADHAQKLAAAAQDPSKENLKAARASRARFENRFKRLRDRIATYGGGQFKWILEVPIAEYEAVREGDLSDKAARDAEHTKMDLLLNALFKAAKEEEAMGGGDRSDRDQLLTATAQEEATARPKGSMDVKRAMWFRNQAMYMAVKKAMGQGFIMAGMGDNHAAALEAYWAEKAENHPPVIRYDTFINDHTEPGE